MRKLLSSTTTFVNNPSNGFVETLHIDKHPILTDQDHERRTKEANKKLKITKADEVKIRNRGGTLVKEITLTHENDETMLHEIIQDISDQDTSVYSHLESIHKKFDKELLFIVEHSSFYPPYLINGEIDFKKIPPLQLQRACTAFLSVNRLWNDYKDGNIVTEDNFEDMYDLYCPDKLDKNLEYCSHLLIKEMFKIVDFSRKNGSTGERRFLFDLTLALINIFKGKGAEDTTKKSRGSVTNEELHKILSDRESLHNVIDSPQSDSLKVQRFQYFALFFSFVYWNLEWKLFWRLWSSKEGRKVEFKMIDRFIDFSKYKDPFKLTGQLVCDSFNEAIVSDVRWVDKTYGRFQSFLLIELQLCLGTIHVDDIVKTMTIDSDTVSKGSFDFCFPLNLNILEIGIINQRELIKGDVDEVSKTTKMMDLGISSTYYWGFRGQWLSEFKYHLIRLNNRKKADKYTQRKIKEFSDFCNEFTFNFTNNMKNSLPEVKQINSLVIAPIHCDLNLIVKSERIYNFDKTLLKALLKGLMLTYKTQAVYYGESKFNSYLLEYSMAWGMNSWIHIREEVLGISSEKTHFQEKSIIDKCDGKRSY